jgi:hypothetical protein
MQPDLAVGGVDKVEWHEPAEPAAARRFHHEVGQLTADRVDDHPGHLTTCSIGTTDASPDHERYLRHRTFLA